MATTLPPVARARREVWTTTAEAAAKATQWVRRPSPLGAGELFAKVIDTLPEAASMVVGRFTSIPETARTLLDTVRGYEYHVINRAAQV